ncbi:MAG TPA: YggS family pyridoxal phosphate-dependent enzyme [Acidobacteriaceae bacterium]|jgi:pyridoxal phosphate enzyme (YggS family)|nr:YggS family pyridoxal phosphate-dependent enzyme [Acidobacteriaceae bacterium]
MSIAANLARVQNEIADACARAGRSQSDVSLMAVSKMHPAAAIVEAYAAGVRLFGENKVQEWDAKIAALPESILHTARFHLIGHLQSNKYARAAALFAAVDTVDSLRIAERLNAAAIALDRKLPVLIEVKLSSEESKHGIAPGAVSEILHAAAGLPALELRGLMTVPPFFDDPEDARPYFKQLRELRDSLNAVHPHMQLKELSMGMSHDFAVAIEEGSTCVRIGTALFGKRDYSQVF